MARKGKLVLVPVDKWCGCVEWKKNEWRLCNHSIMRFCAFCGKRLEKEKRV